VGPLLEAFVLGNGAILTNVCVLPLYPGLVAYLAADAGHARRGAGAAWLGLLVLAGVLTTMIAVGFVLFLLRRSFGTILPVLLPLVYGAVILLGVLLLLGRNPFAGLRTIGGPVFGNPYAAAFAYGLLLGPMTLPCAGPLLVSAFVVGAGSVRSLADSLLYALAFGLGFGWPLIVLPLLAGSAQRHVTRWLAVRSDLLTRLSGLLLVGIGLFGAWADLPPLGR
jgi:cytochrome c-type biogenesis protein